MGAALLALLKFVAPALLPVAADAVRGVVAKWTGGAGASPQTVAEQIQLMQAQTARAEAIAKLDAPAGEISPWVADLRASFRYIAVALIVLVTLGAVLAGANPGNVAVLLDLTGACMAFIIGERMYLKLVPR